MAFIQKLFSSYKSRTDGDTRIGELNRIWYDSNTNTLRIQLDDTPGGTVIGGGGAGGDYTLPTASTTVKGGVKIDGTTITINNQVISGFSGSYTDLTNKPTLFSGSYNDLINKPNLAGTYTFNVAADDSTLRTISSEETVKFVGAGGITTASDAEGKITITGTTVDLSNYVTLDGEQTLTNKTLTSPTITNGVFQTSFTIGNQIFYEHGYNGFSVNENFDIVGESNFTGYHYTSGAGRDGVAFTLARTGQFTDGFGITGDASNNQFVIGGEAGNTDFLFKTGIGMPFNVSGGTTIFTISRDGSLTFADETTQTTAWTGSVDWADVNNQPTIYSSAYIGTTNIAFNRSSASQTLNGVSIDGSILWINSTPAPGDPFRTAISAASGSAGISLTSGLPGLGSTVNWTFDTTKITFPDTTTQTTAYTGNASTATKLATARNINGVAFDGTAAITVTADAGTLTGTTLKSTVVNSSLTSVGTLAGLRTTGLNNFGSNTFTKAGYDTGDITLDNGSTDTPGLLMYYANHNNFAFDSWNGTFNILSGQLLRVVNNLNESGGAVKMAMDTTGNIVTTGFIQPSAWRAGQVIRDIMLNNSEFTVNNTTVATSTTDTTLLTYSYTPTSSSSYLIIHVHVADYRAASDSGGAGTDSYFSRIKVDDAEIVYSRQMTRSGEGFRTGSLFPLTGRYTNSSTTAKTITVAVRRDSADDSITVTNSATALTLRITEIAR